MADPQPFWGGGDFFCVPVEWWDDGTLSKLSRAELLAILGMARHADFSTGKAYPGVERLAPKVSASSKLSHRVESTRRAMRGVEKSGMAAIVKQGGGHKIANVYKLKNPYTGAGVTETKTPAPV